MAIEHFKEQEREWDGLSLAQPRRFVLSSGRPVDFRTEAIPRQLSRLRRNQAPETIDALALRIAGNADLEKFLFRLGQTGALREATIEKWNEAIAFQARYPGWWEQAIEAPLEALSEEHRKTIDDKWDLTLFDIGVGATQGVYQFTKGTVVGIADLFKLAYSLATDSQTQDQALGLIKDWTVFSFKVYFGSAEQRLDAAKTAQSFAQSLFDSIRDSLRADWEKAEKEGKETELVAKWVTLGVLEVATAVLAATKGAKAARAAQRSAESVEIASKPLEAVVKAKKAPRKPKTRFDRVNRSEQRVGRQLLEDWYREHPGIGWDKSKMAKHMSGSRKFTRIRKIKMRRGTVIEQWIRAGGQPGIYCTPLNSDPTKLGIRLQGRIVVRYKVREPIYVLETVIEDFQAGKVAGVGGAGGGIQYIMPPNWERYVQITN